MHGRDVRAGGGQVTDGGEPSAGAGRQPRIACSSTCRAGPRSPASPHSWQGASRRPGRPGTRRHHRPDQGTRRRTPHLPGATRGPPHRHPRHRRPSARRRRRILAGPRPRLHRGRLRRRRLHRRGLHHRPQPRPTRQSRLPRCAVRQRLGQLHGRDVHRRHGRLRVRDVHRRHHLVPRGRTAAGPARHHLHPAGPARPRPALTHGGLAVDVLTGEVDSARCVNRLVLVLVDDLTPYRRSPAVGQFIEAARPLLAT
jgi:hypothetical protein